MELSSKKILLGTGITLSIASLSYFLYKLASKSALKKSKPTHNLQINNTSSGTAKKSVTYENKDIVISFKFPQNWHVAFETYPTFVSFKIIPPTREHGSYFFTIENMKSPLGVPIGVQMYVTSSKINNQMNGYQIKVISEKLLSQDTMETIYDIKGPNNELLREWCVYIVKENKGYIFQYASYVDLFDTKIAKEIYSSLKIF